MQGFLDLNIAMWQRNLVTRTVAIVPSLAVAIFAGASGADELIIWSQILLSIQLPFALIPLLKMTNDVQIMGEDFVNKIGVKVLGVLVGLIIIVSNVCLIALSVLGVLDYSSWLGWIALAIIGVIGVLYLTFLAYLAKLPVGLNTDPPIWKIELDEETSLN